MAATRLQHQPPVTLGEFSADLQREFKGPLPRVFDPKQHRPNNPSTGGCRCWPGPPHKLSSFPAIHIKGELADRTSLSQYALPLTHMVTGALRILHHWRSLLYPSEVRMVEWRMGPCLVNHHKSECLQNQHCEVTRWTRTPPVEVRRRLRRKVGFGCPIPGSGSPYLVTPTPSSATEYPPLPFSPDDHRTRPLHIQAEVGPVYIMIQRRHATGRVQVREVT